MRCYYCDQIQQADSAFIPRPAEFDLGSEAPRCAWHWRFRCDHCGHAGHFMQRFFCPPARRVLCREAGPVTVHFETFWAWEYWWMLTCPECGEEHPSLDHAEFAGVHPWQHDAAAVAERRWLSGESYLTRYPPDRLFVREAQQPTDADSSAAWSANADAWMAGFDEWGDFNRRYRVNESLLAFLGEVRGQRVLDAGSGGGYLSRLLAKRGAQVVAVENARRSHEISLEHQEREPLPIEFHHASISSMPFLADASFAAVVANYVLSDVVDYEQATGEIARVLRPGGRFVCVVPHDTVDSRWHMPIPDSPRREDRAGYMIDNYFVRRGAYLRWPGLPEPNLTFQRPLRDYVAACKRVGLELRDLDEPEVSEEGLRVLPVPTIRHMLRVPWAYVMKFVKGSGA